MTYIGKICITSNFPELTIPKRIPSQRNHYFKLPENDDPVLRIHSNHPTLSPKQKSIYPLSVWGVGHVIYTKHESGRRGHNFNLVISLIVQGTQTSCYTKALVHDGTRPKSNCFVYYIREIYSYTVQEYTVHLSILYVNTYFVLLSTCSLDCSLEVRQNKVTDMFMTDQTLCRKLKPHLDFSRVHYHPNLSLRQGIWSTEVTSVHSVYLYPTLRTQTAVSCIVYVLFWYFVVGNQL